MTSLVRRIGRLDAWLETMRGPGGYGGPVVHWWQHSTRYCGPAMDWRYEGLLTGYGLLAVAEGGAHWKTRLARAVNDLLDAQRADGGLPASAFERNPATLGTPHEAAATLGLVQAAPLVARRGEALGSARRTLDRLVARLWDGRGFDDRPGVPGRVPNKLATLAHAMLAYASVVGDEHYAHHARTALDDVILHQVRRGRAAGAIHQYASGPRADRPDGRFFPYYAARCVPPLVAGAEALGRPAYRSAADAIVSFLDRTMDADGGWPQVVYANGAVARRPRWIAGAADVLLAYLAVDAPLPRVALDRLLNAQLACGGFPTAEGFAASGRDWRDLLPVVGWNDKVLRLMARLVAPQAVGAGGTPSGCELPIRVGRAHGRLYERPDEVRVVRDDGSLHYHWRKGEPWARTVSWEAGIR